MLDQKRELVQEAINRNPFILSGNLYSLQDNGYGQYIEKRTVAPTVTTYTNPVRIYRKTKPPAELNDVSTPYFYEEIYEMQSDYETIVDERLEFVYQGITFKVKNREAIYKFGGIVGYQYELDNITSKAVY